MNAFWSLLTEALGTNFAEDRKLHAQVLRLSRAFTEGREKLSANYFEEADLEPAYLAYFLPLNFEKTRTLLKTHGSAVWSKPPAQPQRWVDLGCGPGTASLGALAALKEAHPQERRSLIHIDLIDTQETALNRARTLVEGFAKKLQMNVKVSCFKTLDEALGALAQNNLYDLTLAANVLNELPAEKSGDGREPLLRLWDKTSGAFFVLEPGHRVSSQRLVRFRERLLKDAEESARIVGPCLHAGRCPVHRTKHWCHFSEPLTDGRLIDLNLRIFKNPRGWLKFSYLLLSRTAEVDTQQSTKTRAYRAIGDLHPSGAQFLAIDLCQPESKLVLRIPRKVPSWLKHKLVRGARVKLDAQGKVTTAQPLSGKDPTGPLSEGQRHKVDFKGRKRP